MATLYLICERSGSMIESGKRFIVRNIIRTIDQYYRLQRGPSEIKLVAWSDEAIVAKWQPGQEVPDALLVCKGEASGEALTEKLKSVSGDYAAIITDGYWTSETRRAVGSWSKALGANHLRIIKVGEDADLRMKGPSVFEAEDLLAALKGWIV